MAFTAIRTATADGVATITLARPERLNAFTSAMHAELREALDAAETRRRGALRGADRGGARLLGRTGPDRGARARTGRQARFRRAARARLQSAGRAHLCVSQGDDRGAQRADGRRVGQHRARLRYPAGGALRLSAGGLRQDRAGAGCGRHLVAAAHRRRQARARADAHRRPDSGRRAGAHGAGLQGVRRCGLPRRGRPPMRAASPPARR